MERISFIDGLKGYAIILVVIGHVITYASPSDFGRSWLFSFIYSFHMPLFLFLSGFLVYRYPPGQVFPFIVKKLKVLVYPYFLWLFIFAIAAGGIVVNGTVISNFAFMVKSYSLWFLPALFISLLVLICYRYVEDFFAAARKTEVAAPVVFLVLYLVTWVVPISFSLFLILRWFSPFVLLGYLASKHWQRILEIEYLMPISALLFVLLLPSWGSYSVSFTISHYYTPLIDFVLAVAGIGFAFLLVTSLKETKAYGFLQTCGMYSLEIYILSAFLPVVFTSLLHVPFWAGSGLVAYITGSAVVFSLSLLGSVILSYYQYPGFILFGRWTPHRAGISRFRPWKG